MTTFEDGQAKGKHLMLKRSPCFLRVVESNGKIDALDQLADEPAPEEKVFVYILKEKPGMCHINSGRGRGGFYPVASYRLAEKQPMDHQARSERPWAAWCQLNSFLVQRIYPASQ